MRQVAVGLMMVAAAGPVAPQVRTVDPNEAGAMRAPAATPADGASRQAGDAGDPADTPPPPAPMPEGTAPPAPPTPASNGVTDPAEQAAQDKAANRTYAQQDVLSAAEGVFGKGAAGLAGLIQKILKDQGQPTAYIAGREAGGAFIAGVRYGSGTLFHKVEGQRPIYWTGPSVGFDLGASGAKTFVLVYNLYDTQDLYHRFPQVEGQAYFVGGFNASYLRWGHIVVIPIRLGVGWRLGANIGYMNFTAKSRWVPF